MQNLSLADIIHPCDVNIFLDHYLEEQPLVVKRSIPQFFDSLISKHDINDIVNKAHTLGCFNAIANHPYRTISSSEFAVLSSHENLEIKIGVNSAGMRHLINSGASITFTSLQKIMPRIGSFFNSFRKEFTAHLECSLTLFGPGPVEFAPTFAVHDTYILQIVGSTALKIFQPSIELPLSNQLWAERELIPQSTATLFAGDIAYFPRGYGTQCVSSEVSSAQLIIHSYNTTWAKVIHELVNEIALEEDSLRMSYNVAALKTSDDTKLILEKIKGALQEKMTVSSLRRTLQSVSGKSNEIQPPRISEMLNRNPK
jgi:ribosomal protein L16 Arg81 hydroxylase